MDSYQKKTEISGYHFRETEYTANHYVELERPKGKQICQRGIEPNPEEPIKEKQKSLASKQRTIRNIADIIHCNITKYSKFITLTFAETTLDRKEAMKCFKEFQIYYFRYFGVKLKYLCNQERQKDRGKKEGNEGSWHFHFVNFSDKYLDFKILDKCWPYGFVLTKRIKRPDQIHLYFAKYLHKQITDIKINQKAVTMSRSLKKPQIEYDTNVKHPLNAMTYEHTTNYYDCNETLLYRKYIREYNHSKVTPFGNVKRTYINRRILDGRDYYTLS